MPALQYCLRVMRLGTPFAILAVCLLVLWPAFAALDMADLERSWQALGLKDWVLAVVFTMVSFFAIGQYDVIAHRQLDTGLPAEMARISGMTAIALSQTVGFGPLTATLARWRLLNGFGAGVSALVTAFVTLTFLAALTALTALACLLLPAPDHVVPIALGVLPVLFGLLYATVRFPRVTLRGHKIELPGLRATSAACVWAALDVFAACLALWMLIPEVSRPDFLAFLPVFCIALWAGLFSGTPAGLGPFELVLLVFCAAGQPAATEIAALLGGVVAFRLVYFAVPAAIAGLALLVRPARIDVWRDPEPPHLRTAPRAETAVIRQNGGTVERTGATYAALWPTGQALVAMFDPFDPPGPGFFVRLDARARERNRFALIYKSSARTALAARQAGWICVHGADDAVIDLDTYTVDTPERSGLRRKLRKAAKAGVTIRPMRRSDLPRMAEVDAEWQAVQQGARGGSMGRFCPAYLDTQHVLVAEVRGRITAFVSLQCSTREWAVDLMRNVTETPDGTMHALVHAGIDAATAAGVQRFSLAAVPACPNPQSAFWRFIAFRVVAVSRSAGLRQFKSAFAPRWQPLYFSAPSRLALVIGALDVAREVFLPTRLSARPTDRGTKQLNATQHDDEIYEVASDAAA